MYTRGKTMDGEKITNKQRRINERSLANLRPFKKGENGNSPGRPKSADCLISCIKTELARMSNDGIYTNEQRIAMALTHKAVLGDTKAIELLMAYTTPKPTASVDVTTGGEKIRTFSFVLPDGTKVLPGQSSNAV